MARRSKGPTDRDDDGVLDYRHGARRLNNPPAGLVTSDYSARETSRTHYAYDPHLSPQLVWAGKPGLASIEIEDEAGVEVEDVALHVHERVSTRAILEAVRRPEPRQLDLFADPQLPLDQALRFYQHDVDWANRLILGDSLLVMSSLLTREGLRGKVQMIYLDPPYGVNYKSNFQPRIDQRDVREDDSGLSREPEQIRAYRDTWTLGVHSYLTYLRDRLRLCRDLLTESGSIFVQISDENVHRVRLLMDEIFGAENFCSLIAFSKTTAQTSRLVPSIADFLLWYARDTEYVRYRPLFDPKAFGEAGASKYRSVELADGRRIPYTQAKHDDEEELPEGARLFRVDNLTSSREGRPHGLGTSGNFPVEFDGKKITPPANIAWKTNEPGMARLLAAGRVTRSSNTLGYIRYLDDFPALQRGNVWTDVGGIQSRADPKVYVVQTSTTAVQRCLLMTTDPGDLVLDPTCGSGTTAYVAEQWGRRWITCDTSRVALALARQRLMTATFPFYELADERRGVDGGLVYRTVPHIQLSDYARNTRIDPIVERYAPLLEAAEACSDQDEVARLTRERRAEIDRVVAEDSARETLYDQPKVVRGVTRVSGPFTVEAIPPVVLELTAPTPILGPPERADGGEEDDDPASAVVADEAAAHIPRLIADLARDGVTFPDNRVLRFESLTPRPGVLHAEGTALGDADLRTVAISFGPLNGAVSLAQVEDAFYEARGGYDAVVFCGFSFEPEAQAFIGRNRDNRRLKAFLAHIRPDVLLTDARGESLLKTQANSQLFAVFGEPDVALAGPDAENTYRVTLHGVDVYDPTTGLVASAPTERIAAWFVDADYDGRAFCIGQAFFPNVDAWDKIARALKGRLDEARLDALSGNTSLPFEVGRHRRVAVKVIDQRGNEVMRVLSLAGAAASSAAYAVDGRE